MKILFALLALAPILASAQDRRTVTEPMVPPPCASLQADKSVGPDRNMDPKDELRSDTQRIQNAIDHCKSGAAVVLATDGARNAFLSGPLALRDGVTLQVAKGATLYASRNPADYDEDGHPGVCGTVVPGHLPRKGGCRPLIAVTDVKNAAVMGPGAIDGRGDMRLTGHTQSWWQKARQAEPNNDKLYSTRLVVARRADGFVLYQIRLHNSPNFHVTVNDTDGFTAWDVHLQSPTVHGTDARNTDGIDPGSSTNITIAHSWIDTDDDNVAIKTGVSHMSVLHNHFYHGHGMSIGSETYTGQSKLLVDDLVLDHTTSGIRIKSNVTRGGPVRGLVYQNICMRDVGVPIAISPYYMGQTIEKFVDPGLQGERIPDYKEITLRNIHVLTPGDILIAGLNAAHRTEVTLENVHVAGMRPELAHFNFADVTDAGTNIPLNQGQALQVRGKAQAKPPYDCTGKFVPMQ